MDEEEATAAAAERIAATAEDGTSLPVNLATDAVRFLYGGTGRREPADGGVVSASLLNAKPAVGGIGVEPRGGGVLRVLFTVASDAVADTVVRWRHELRRCVDSTAVFDVLSDREEAQHQALWPAFLAAKVAGKRAQFHRARLVVDGERVGALVFGVDQISLEEAGAIPRQTVYVALVEGSRQDHTVVTNMHAAGGALYPTGASPLSPPTATFTVARLIKSVQLHPRAVPEPRPPAGSPASPSFKSAAEGRSDRSCVQGTPDCTADSANSAPPPAGTDDTGATNAAAAAAGPPAIVAAAAAGSPIVVAAGNAAADDRAPPTPPAPPLPAPLPSSPLRPPAPLPSSPLATPPLPPRSSLTSLSSPNCPPAGRHRRRSRPRRRCPGGSAPSPAAPPTAGSKARGRSGSQTSSPATAGRGAKAARASAAAAMEVETPAPATAPVLGQAMDVDAANGLVPMAGVVTSQTTSQGELWPHGDRPPTNPIE
ncbi:hypothetical protein FOA52_004204 [Chlamydomonas sp. UWO 241]|nr:hypothetical protein FOA52_004204 [Chlamydomonas sp. UWO 241]